MDVSGVIVQEYREHNDESVGGMEMISVSGNNGICEGGVTEACMFCNAYGGYVVRCSYNHSSSSSSSGEPPSSSSPSSSQSSCNATFHPLCAWFQGGHIETMITDPTFQVVIMMMMMFTLIDNNLFAQLDCNVKVAKIIP